MADSDVNISAASSENEINNEKIIQVDSLPTAVSESQNIVKEDAEDVQIQSVYEVPEAAEDENVPSEEPAPVDDQTLAAEETVIEPHVNTTEDYQKKPYIQPLENPYEKAWKYLFKHDILSLFQSLTADIAATLPEDSIQFMITEIKIRQEFDRRRKGMMVSESEEKLAANKNAEEQSKSPIPVALDKDAEPITGYQGTSAEKVDA